MLLRTIESRAYLYLPAVRHLLIDFTMSVEKCCQKIGYGVDISELLGRNYIDQINQIAWEDEIPQYLQDMLQAVAACLADRHTPNTRQTLQLILRLNRERQMTVLISSHILDELSRLATHYGIIDGGKMVKELSAEELENACRKCMRMEVTKVTALTRVLDGMGIDYKVLSETNADVYAKINISQLTLALAKEGCEVLSIEEKDESLESYFVSLVGGGSHG